MALETSLVAIPLFLSNNPKYSFVKSGTVLKLPLSQTTGTIPFALAARVTYSNNMHEKQSVPFHVQLNCSQ